MLLLFVTPSCTRQADDTGPRYGASETHQDLKVYKFAVHPLHNPAKLVEVYQPLLDSLNSRLSGARLELEASRDYASFEEKYKAGKPEFLLPNPWQTLQAMTVKYHVIAMAGESADFRGLFIVRRDSDITRPLELKGRSVSYPSPTALAACIMPQYFLHLQGLDVNRDIVNRYVGSQESSIMSVYLKQSSVGATWPPPWRAFQKNHPREAAELKIVWETDSLINNSVMVRNDVPEQLSVQVRSLLVGLAGSDDGRALLKHIETTRFIVAGNPDYDVVRNYITRFEREVRPVEQR